MLIPGVKSEKTAKMSVEPLLCFVAGIAAGVAAMHTKPPSFEPLAGWILISGSRFGVRFRCLRGRADQADAGLA